MRKARYGLLAGLALTIGTAEARDPTPVFAPLPAAPAREEPASPYPMTYADEVARRLGIAHGRLDVFSTPESESSLVPSLKGGVDRNGAGIKLQWRLGK